MSDPGDNGPDRRVEAVRFFAYFLVFFVVLYVVFILLYIMVGPPVFGSPAS